MAKASASVITSKQNRIFVEVRGTAPLIMNSFSQKSLEQMLRKHMGHTVTKEAKVPSECVKNATIYNVAGEVCMPTTAFKKGMLSAAAQSKSFAKTKLRVMLFVCGNSVPIVFKERSSRMDVVRVGGKGAGTGTPDIRFRPQFDGWSARLGLLFADCISVEAVIDLLDAAGNVGIGEWRPEKDGNFGTYAFDRAITDEAEMSEVMAACAPAICPLRIPDWAQNEPITDELLRHCMTPTGEEGDSE